jgi:hypothetical protein
MAPINTVLLFVTVGVAATNLTIEQQKEAARRGAFLEGARVDW